MNKLKMESVNLTEQNIDKIAELFPQVVTEVADPSGAMGEDGKPLLKKAIDFEKLKLVLSAGTGDYVVADDERERYEFTWVGKRQAMIDAATPIRKTLRPCPEDSKDWATTENLYIEGDNLEVLKLLQESYLGKVKMIYIDPPYNTGKDFIYKDNFAQSREEYEDELDMFDEEGNRLFQNTETNGRFHSDWCSMIYPRLQLARNLLTDDGVIFISIGVEEVANLKTMMNEVFGETNFVEIFSWVKTSTPPALSTKSRKTNEYIICYEKNLTNIQYKGELLSGGSQPLLNSGNSLRVLTFPSEKVYFKPNQFPDGIIACYSGDRVELLDQIEINNGYATTNFRLKGEFKWTQDFLDEEISNGTHFVINTIGLGIRFYRISEGYKRPTNYIKEQYTSPIVNKVDNKVDTNETASKETVDLLDGNFFDHPKPVSLIKYLTNFTVEANDIVLDFFSGSATTAHAVMQLNAEDGGKRKFIMVQLPEVCAPNSEAAKAGYKTICEIGKERIRRAGEKINKERIDRIQKEAEKEGVVADIASLDTGFRVFKLDTTNMKDVYYAAGEISQKDLWDTVSNIKDDRSDIDLLYGCLLDWGVYEGLQLPHTTETIGGYRVHTVDDKRTDFIDLIACFDEKISEETVRTIAARKPLRAVFRDSSFTDSADKINVAEIFKALSPDTTVKVI